MIIHCKFNGVQEGDGVKVGKCQIWAEGCEDNVDKALAECVGHFILSGVESLNFMSGNFFTPPAEGGAK